jgi:hypothetical protein
LKYHSKSDVVVQERSVSVLMLIGLGAIGWSSHALFTGKGYYKGCPPGGYDRELNPFGFWAPTIIIFCLGLFALLVSLGLIPVHPRQ